MSQEQYLDSLRVLLSAACTLKLLARLDLSHLRAFRVLPHFGWIISGVTPYTTLLGGCCSAVGEFRRTALPKYWGLLPGAGRLAMKKRIYPNDEVEPWKACLRFSC